MSKIKKVMMDPENHPDTLNRVYLVGDKKVDRETFIKSLAYGLFEYVDIEMEPDFQESNVYDIRAMIHEFITAGSQASLKIDGVIYSSYYEFVEKKEYSLKRYNVSFDILVRPALKFHSRDKWKRDSVEQIAYSYADAREKFKKGFKDLNPDRKIKRVKVELIEDIKPLDVPVKTDPDNPENELKNA